MVCDCGTPWTFHLLFLELVTECVVIQSNDILSLRASKQYTLYGDTLKIQ